MKNNFLGSIYLTLAASIWGGAFVASKYTLDYIPSFTLLWIRYVIAFIILIIMSKRFEKNNDHKVKLKKSDYFLLAWIGFIGYFVSVSVQFIGTKLSDAHTGSVITSASPTFIVLFGGLILKEKFTSKKIASLIMATIGVMLIIGLNKTNDNCLWGNMLLIIAALTWGLLSVYVKIASKKFSSMYITIYAIFFAIIFTTPFMIWEINTTKIVFNSPSVILGILYLGIFSTAIAYYLWNKGLELMEDTGKASLFFFFQPLAGSILGCLILKEKLTINFFVGTLLILTGVFIMYLKPMRKKRRLVHISIPKRFHHN